MFGFLFGNNNTTTENKSKDKKEMNARVKQIKDTFSKYNKSCPALFLESNGHGITGVYCQAGNREVNHSMNVGDFFGGWSVTRYSRYKCFTNKHKNCPYREKIPAGKGQIKVNRNAKNNQIRDFEIEKIKQEFKN